MKPEEPLLITNSHQSLRPLPYDDRDFTVGALISLPPLTELPPAFDLGFPTEWILRQGNDTCAGHAVSMASSLQEDVRLDPLFTWILARSKQGYSPQDWGIDLRSIADVAVKVGSLEIQDAPFTDTAGDEWRDIANWSIDELIKKAVIHKKGSYVFVEPTNGYSMYDTIRAIIWKFRDKKTAVVMGIKWPYGDTSPITNYQEGGYGHAIAITGWDNLNLQGYVINVGSWGKQVGENGIFKIHKSIINDPHNAQFGAFFFIDETPENIKKALEQGVRLDDNWIRHILISLYTRLIKLLKQLKETGMPPYLWDTPEHTRKSIRIICDEEGLTFCEKERICAVIQHESGFKNHVTCSNRGKNGEVWSTDWGICQINDYYHIGVGKTFPSVEYVLNNPDKVVRWMIKMYKRGYLKWWVAYSSGAYKKYLSAQCNY